MYEQQLFLYLLGECVSFLLLLLLCFFFTAGLTFRDNSNSMTVERGSVVTLRFTVEQSCIATRLQTITVTNVTDAASLPVPYCQFVHYRGRCDSSFGTKECSCDPDTEVYTAHIHVTGVHRELWRVDGEMAWGFWSFDEVVIINIKRKLIWSFFP